MDTRRFLILAASGLLVSGCALFRPETGPPLVLAGASPPTHTTVATALEEVEPTLTPPLMDAPSTTERPYAEALRASVSAASQPMVLGRTAIVAANSRASAPSRSDAFVGGVQVFAWSPGRVFEVWTAPLRVTTLTLGDGETLITKAAGDTIRWQIGEAISGEGAGRRTHVLLKPLERGLETNLVLTTNKRVYLIDLKSGAADGFNAAVAWDSGAPDLGSAGLPAVESLRDMRVPDPVVTPEGPLDARYRIQPQGRQPRWTPSAVFNDGRRTFIAFDPDIQVDEAPALFVVAPGGETQLVNYRQAGGLLIVDRVFDQAELRLGDRRPQVVRILRIAGD